LPGLNRKKVIGGHGIGTMECWSIGIGLGSNKDSICGLRTLNGLNDWNGWNCWNDLNRARRAATAPARSRSFPQ
jgi:hypothetical protein